MGHDKDRLAASAATALHHIELARQELKHCVSSTSQTIHEEVSAPADLLTSYLCLKREHEALRAQYESDMRRWLAFKQWWKGRLWEKRRRRATRPTSSPSKAASSTWSPRKAREQVLQHRQQVREMMQKDPMLFKGLGRYSATTRYATSLTQTCCAGISITDAYSPG